MKPRDPEGYWTPALGHYLHLRPRDIADLTLEQFQECREALLDTLTDDG